MLLVGPLPGIHLPHDPLAALRWNAPPSALAPMSPFQRLHLHSGPSSAHPLSNINIDSAHQNMSGLQSTNEPSGTRLDALAAVRHHHTYALPTLHLPIIPPTFDYVSKHMHNSAISPIPMTLIFLTPSFFYYVKL
jgi:hypothetical protein